MWGSTTIPEVQDKVPVLWKIMTRQVSEFQNTGLSHVLWDSWQPEELKHTGRKTHALHGL